MSASENVATVRRIRYELEDRVVMLDGPNPGPWTGRRVAAVEGRTTDVFMYDGNAVHPTVIKDVVETPGVIDYQVRQTHEGVAVGIVVAGTIDEDAMRSSLEGALANCGVHRPKVDLHIVAAVPRHPVSGKVTRFVPLDDRT